MRFNFKKRYGQNFLIDKNITKKIANIVDEKENSLVVEVGCGDGKLTRELCLIYNNVLGYEIDLDLKEHLLKNLKNFKNKEIIFDDFLKRNIKKDIENYGYKNLYIISNLPYYITTPIIEKIIKEKLNPKQMILMVQKEVGDRFCAKVGTKEYNSLTLYLNYYFEIKKEFIVNRNSFIPKPNVDSVIVSFKRKDNPIKLKNEDIFFKLIKDSFSFKRKNLKNNLKNYDLQKINEILTKYKFDITVRAEQLPLEIFCDIANNI